jgi:hypothetical protein
MTPAVAYGCVWILQVAKSLRTRTQEPGGYRVGIRRVPDAWPDVSLSLSCSFARRRCFQCAFVTGLAKVEPLSSVHMAPRHHSFLS